MSALDDLKKTWKGAQQPHLAAAPYDAEAFHHIIHTSMKKQNNRIFGYFWATFTFHLMLYALLSHVIVRYHTDTAVLMVGLVGVAVTVPFTAMMLKRYKQMAAPMDRQSMTSLYTYIQQQRSRLDRFYAFKKSYEILLVPLLSAIGVFLVFHLYFPGGILAFPLGAAVTYLLTLLSCLLAIRTENQKYFRQPLQELQAILNDYRS